MVQSDLLAIAAIRDQTMRAENASDADFFDSACTDDVVVMPPGMPVVVGRQAAVGFMRGFFDAFEVTIAYVSEETRIAGNLAYDRGTYTQSLKPKGGGDELKESGNFLWLYQHASDGSWKMSRVIWNASHTPPMQ